MVSFKTLTNPPTKKIKFAIRIKFNHNVHVQSSGLPQAGIKAQNLKFELAKRFPSKYKNSSNIRDFMAIFTERVPQRESWKGQHRFQIVNSHPRSLRFRSLQLKTLRRSWHLGYRVGGGGVLPYMGYIGMCRCEGYGFQDVHSGIGYINQRVWV